MNIMSILIAALVVGGTGVIIGLLLGLAAKAFEVEVVSFEEILRRADFVSLHMPLTDETKDLVSLEEMKKMKQIYLKEPTMEDKEEIIKMCNEFKKSNDEYQFVGERLTDSLKEMSDEQKIIYIVDRILK